MSTIYAAFMDASSAEKAAGALLDNGANEADISIIANEAFNSTRAVIANENAAHAEADAKSGISTTTGADAARGAVKGASIGVGVGAAAVLASIFVPGLGLILGGGALATALAGGAATIAAGAAAGGVVGYLKDQGVAAEMATRYNAAFEQGGAIMSIAIPTGKLPTGELEMILAKYGAANIATYNNPVVGSPDGIPVVPVATAAPAPMIETASPTVSHRVIDASTGDETIVTTAPTTAAPMVDAVTGAVIAPAAVVAPVSGVVVDPVTGLAVDVPVAAVPPRPTGTGVVIDPITGVETPATIAQGYAGEAVVPVEEDVIVENADGSARVVRNVDLL